MTEHSFDAGILARLRESKEVDIETRSPKGEVHRATILETTLELKPG